MRCMLLQEPATGRIEGHPAGLAQQVLAGVPRCLAALHFHHALHGAGRRYHHQCRRLTAAGLRPRKQVRQAACTGHGR
ncbi:hypothetical protein G6F65_022249 [Rhizopus arrhizus]|nr:hypothetical protein G6F65_022249 [Rhizopus arrhizus]